MRRIFVGLISGSALLVGCATTRRGAETVSVAPSNLPPSYQHVAALKPAAAPVRIPNASRANVIQAAGTGEKVPVSETTPGFRPAYAQLETLPIDLPTTIRMVNEQSPTIGFARERANEAQARLRSAELQWLPNFSVGLAYTRFDGQTQNQRGEVFDVSRGNFFAGGGPSLSLDFAEAIYRPLIERRVAAAEQLRFQATAIGSELDAILAYIDLVQVHALLQVNADTLAKAESMLTAAKNAKESKLDRTAGDVNRSLSEVLIRKAERLDLEARCGVASARLGKLLLLPSNVKLVPVEIAIVPVTLIDPNSSLDNLLAMAVANRPDLAAHREAIAAAQARVRKQQRGPFLPKVAVTNQVGGFGGGTTDELENFGARNALSVQMFWEFKNLGFGNRWEVNERRAGLEQTRYQFLEGQARVVAEIVEAAQLAGAKSESLGLAEQAVKEAEELYRINKEGVLNVVDAKNLFDALRPLQAIQVLNQAKQNYLAAVLDFNRAQYRLFALTGNTPPSTRPVTVLNDRSKPGR